MRRALIAIAAMVALGAMGYVAFIVAANNGIDLVLPRLSASASSVVAADVLLWPGPGAKLDSRLKSWVEDAPCGPVALVTVSRLPSTKAGGTFQSELAVELSSQGKVIGTWPKPLDVRVWGIEGDQLLVGPYRDGAHSGLLISHKGDLRVVRASEPPTSTVELCPAIPAFKGSAYLRCWRLSDAATKTVHHVAYEGACT